MPRTGLLTTFLGFSLVACGQENRPAPSETINSQPATSPNSQRSISLRGDWRVAGLDGLSFDEPVGVALRGDDAKIWWEPRCAGMARSYQVTPRSITFNSLEPKRAPGSPTPPVCAIGLPPRLTEVFAALDAATSIERTSENGIRISGRGRSVTLFSQ